MGMEVKYNIITSFTKMTDIEKLKEAGANTIIIGIPFFSVRSTNFLDQDEFVEAIALCEKLGLQKYVLINRFFVEKELEDLRKVLEHLKAFNLDGIYFTDMAVYYEAAKLGMESLLIYNPDTILTSSPDINAYLDLNLKACLVSKEITLEEVLSIAENSDAPRLEVFIHGYMNMLHSKRQLLTNYMAFLKRDDQVRYRHDLRLKEEKRPELMPVMEDDAGTHIFTGYRLATFNEIKTLYDAGIVNYRIESLFENIDDLCSYIKAYKRILDEETTVEEVMKEFGDEYYFDSGFMYKKTGLLK